MTPVLISEMETRIQRSSVHQTAKFDLNSLTDLTAFKLTNVQWLTRNDENKRIERGKRLLRYMTLANLEKTSFTDEKIFKLHAPNNKQNVRMSG